LLDREALTTLTEARILIERWRIIVATWSCYSTMNRIGWLLRRAKQILQTEGLIPLVRQASAFVVQQCFVYKVYYLDVSSVEKFQYLSEADFMPKIDNFTLKIISTDQDADEVEADGLEFRSLGFNARDALDKGAIALYVFVGKELANVSWIAMTEEAKLGIRELPYRVDFSCNEACHAGMWTAPKYRGMRFARYASVEARRLLWEKGKVRIISLIVKGNQAAHRSYAIFGHKTYAEARYLRILWWKSWKEKELEQPNVHPG